MVPVSLEILDGEGAGLRMKFSGRDWQSFTGSNLFKCLLCARTALEKEDLLLCCQGARPDVFPSGMQQQMEHGRFAAVLSRSGEEEGAVDIFAAAEPSQVTSVEAQRVAVYQFFNLPVSDAGGDA
ncbi:hypothetical protein VSH64_45520 [Amycolatopsis rhabdoformis]|uniref:Uncharacterized protein n=1 Tax=Amycolatopsis rhabdoformis TaxID=1448059 RepID=A0ABZ1I8S0_9PSEU|nr:hypothetical protein [Amycolatopsis rhabdoformis]WSE29978.1 hypothetical protein VSH64_45520 [Amycolatopsis rhabdoformis]